MKQRAYLIAPVHIDPVRLWDWTEGVAVTLETFRHLVSLCRQHPELRVTLQETLPIRWVEQYAPELFAQLRQFVAEGRWHIAGGWYVQPDCNLPCAEAMARQLLLGRRFVTQTFAVEPTAVLNTDSFGHSRGLVQLLVRSGDRMYIFCHPAASRLPLPQDLFLWEGVDGSRIVALRVEPCDTTTRGEAAAHQQQAHAPAGIAPLRLWDLGNHGGGCTEAAHFPRLAEEQPDWELHHATLEEYAAAVESLRSHLPVVTQSLRPWAVGAYTSGMRLKQLYRRAEDRLLLAEKLVTCAAFHGRMAYPADELRHAWEELLFCQSSGILSGVCTESAMHAALNRLSSVLRTAEELLFRAFVRLSAGQPPAAGDGLPVLVYNPHPYPVTTLLECELQPEEPFPEGAPLVPQLFSETGTPIPCQALRPESPLVQPRRVRISFRLRLEPQRMRRLICRFAVVSPSSVSAREEPDHIRIRTSELELLISRHTGQIAHYRVRGREYARSGLARLLAVPDSADPWGIHVRHFWRKARPFRVLPKEKAAWFAGTPEALHPVRIIEQGELCTVVEVLLHHRYRSFACVHYVIPHEGTELELRLRLLWNERDTLVKLAFPTRLLHARCYGQSMAAVEEFSTNGMEHVAQRWICLVEGGWAFSCITDSTYGFGCRSGELRLSLLRSPAYAAHPGATRKGTFLAADRFMPRMDQGEHQFRFWLNAGDASTRLEQLERETQIHLQPPLVFPLPTPPSAAAPAEALLQVDDPAVVVTALKQSEDGSELLLRLWEPTGHERFCRLHFPVFGFSTTVRLSPFAFLTLRIDPQQRRVQETDLVERPLS